jgi:hypothetical protein
MIVGRLPVRGGAMGSGVRWVALWLVRVLPAAPSSWVFYHSGLAHGIWSMHVRDGDWKLARDARAWIDEYEGARADG